MKNWPQKFFDQVGSHFGSQDGAKIDEKRCWKNDEKTKKVESLRPEDFVNHSSRLVKVMKALRKSIENLQNLFFCEKCTKFCDHFWIAKIVLVCAVHGARFNFWISTWFVVHCTELEFSRSSGTKYKINQFLLFLYVDFWY